MEWNGTGKRRKTSSLIEREKRRETEYVGSSENKDADVEDNGGTTIHIWLKSRDWRRVINTHITATISKTDNQSDRCNLTE